MEIPRRTETIQKHKKQGGGVAAVLPIHYPRALLRAFDLLPVEVWGPPRLEARYGAAHLQPYVCSIVQNALTFLEAGGLEVANVLLVPHACDSLQGLGSILTDFVRPRQPVLTLYLPRGGRPSDLDFLTEELHALYRQLQAATGRSPSDAKLLECNEHEENADGLLTELYQHRIELPLDDEHFYRLVRSREYLPAEEFVALAQEALSSVDGGQRGNIPVLLSGIVPEPMSLFAALAELGGWVAADDLACCGRRLYPPGQSSNPFRRMAERILAAPPDPTRGSPLPARIDHLIHLMQVSGARGAVFYDVKFCEPELFDLPQLRQALRQAGYPSLCLEVDLNDGLAQPALNRLAAFLEMLA